MTCSRKAPPGGSEPRLRGTACVFAELPAGRCGGAEGQHRHAAAATGAATAFADTSSAPPDSGDHRKTHSSDCPMEHCSAARTADHAKRTAHIGPGIADAWRDGLDRVPSTIMRGAPGSVKANYRAAGGRPGERRGGANGLGDPARIGRAPPARHARRRRAGPPTVPPIRPAESGPNAAMRGARGTGRNGDARAGGTGRPGDANPARGPGMAMRGHAAGRAGWRESGYDRE